MADKQVTPFQLTDQFTMDNFNQRIEETNTALENIDVYTKAQTLSDATKLQYGLNSNAVPDDVFERLSHFTPTGAVFWLASETIPEGFLLCDGSSVSRADYPLLFQAIGTAFGSDNGTTFKLPDLRAKFIRGSGSSGGYSATFGNTQAATSIYQPVNVYDADKTGSSKQIGNGTIGDILLVYDSSVRPYNIALTPIIKYL